MIPTTSDWLEQAAQEETIRLELGKEEGSHLEGPHQSYSRQAV